MGETKRPTVRIGVFIPSDCQLFDAACVDVFGSLSHEYMTMVSALMPAALVDSAPSVAIRYIGTVQPNTPIPLTSNTRVLATHHYSDPAVAPGTLDIVLMPGPDPFVDPLAPAEALDWLRRQGEAQGTDILSVCTGIFLLGAAGLVKGRTVCGPRGLQDLIKTKGFGERELVGHKYRWIQDGNIWSSGGVTNGNDLVAAYCRQSKHFPNPLVEIICETMDVGDRAQEYGKTQPSFILTVMFHSFRAWLASFGRQKVA